MLVGSSNDERQRVEKRWDEGWQREHTLQSTHQPAQCGMNIDGEDITHFFFGGVYEVDRHSV